jgi:hypothetical protein
MAAVKLKRPRLMERSIFHTAITTIASDGDTE